MACIITGEVAWSCFLAEKVACLVATGFATLSAAPTTAVVAPSGDAALASVREERADAGAESKLETATHATAAQPRTAKSSADFEVDWLPLRDRPTTSWGLMMI